MCVVSMVGDFYHEKWNPLLIPNPNVSIDTKFFQTILPVSREEFDSLKKEVLEMKELLRRAKIYDEKNGEPNCEVEAKLVTLKKIAELVGISLDDVFPKKENK